MCYWEDVTCVLWSCRYSRAVIRSCLPAWEKASWGEEERKMARSRREKETTDKSQHSENIKAIVHFLLNKHCLHVFLWYCVAKLHQFMKRGYNGLKKLKHSDLNALIKVFSVIISAKKPPRSFLIWWSLTFLIWWINEKWEISWQKKKGQPTAQAWSKGWGKT